MRQHCYFWQISLNWGILLRKMFQRPQKKNLNTLLICIHKPVQLWRVMLSSKSIADLKRIYYFFNGGHTDFGRLSIFWQSFHLTRSPPSGLMSSALLPFAVDCSDNGAYDGADCTAITITRAWPWRHIETLADAPLGETRPRSRARNGVTRRRSPVLSDRRHMTRWHVPFNGPI